MDKAETLATLLEQIRLASGNKIKDKPQALARLALVQRILDQLTRIQRSGEESDRSADDR